MILSPHSVYETRGRPSGGWDNSKATGYISSLFTLIASLVKGEVLGEGAAKRMVLFA